MIHWIENENSLEAEIIFQDFVAAWGFLTKVALLAEKHHHHPSIFCSYNVVRLRLSTHDAGDKVTQKDKDLASEIRGLTDN